MAVYYVRKSIGDDSTGNGSYAAPYLTVEKAATVADDGAGNIVEILDSGVYEETDIETFVNAITVRATGTNSPTLAGDMSDHYAFKSYASGNYYEGLNFVNYVTSPHGGGNGAGKYFKMDGCVAHYTGTQNVVDSTTDGMSEIHNSKLVSYGNNTITVNHNRYFLVTNSVLATNDVGSAVIMSSKGYFKTTASFCTCIGSGYDVVAERSYILMSGLAKVKNCIISGTGIGINANVSEHNLVHVTSGESTALPWVEYTTNHHYNDDAGVEARTASLGEITGDPLFVSGSHTGVENSINGDTHFASQDFSLQRLSPAVDAGARDGWCDGYDIIDTKRKQGCTWDIGAYEYIPIGGNWTEYESHEKLNVDSDLALNSVSNTLKHDHKFDKCAKLRQACFSLVARGPISLRGRTIAYKVELGGNKN